MSNIQLFKSQVNQVEYLKNGFIKQPLLTENQCVDILSKLLTLKPDDNYAPNRQGASNYHCTFLDTNEDYKRACNSLFKSYFNPIIDELFFDYQLWNANLYVKPPGEGKFEIHQNWTHTTNEKDTTFTIWCPLVATSIKNGTIALVKGSHKITPDIATLDVPYYFHNIEQSLLDSFLEPIPCDAGEGIIFEDGIIHFSDINLSNTPRYALQILVGPKKINPVYYYFDKNNPEKGFEVFEINEDFFIKTNHLNFKNRPIRYKSLGFIPNSNKLVDEETFIKLLENGNKRRNELYGYNKLPQ